MAKIVLCILVLMAAPVWASGEGPGAERPDKTVLIVDRRADSVTLYFSMPATELAPTFGTGADALLDAEGTVDINLLYEGTYDLADEIFAPVRIELDGQPVAFEALSMMVHDPDVLPGFETPWDGETSIAVCTSPETVDRMGLETLQAYLGYYAWKVNGLAPVTMTFPQSGQALGEIEVREFWNLQHTGTRKVSPEADGSITFAAGEGARLELPTLWLLAAACLGLGLVFLALHQREQT